MNKSGEKRPVGIAILSWLHMISGILGFIIFIFLFLIFRNNPPAINSLSSIGIPPLLSVIGVFFILAMTIISGIGMWKGKKWGWMLGSFNYLYEVVRHLNALFLVPAISSMFSAEDLSQASRYPAFYYVKIGVLVIIAGLIYLYFFKGSVRLYFDVFEMKKWKLVLAQIGICFLIVLSFAVASEFLTNTTDDEQEAIYLDSLYNRGEYEEAIEEGTKYAESYPQSYNIWTQLGWAYINLEEFMDARKCFLEGDLNGAFT